MCTGLTTEDETKNTTIRSKENTRTQETRLSTFRTVVSKVASILGNPAYITNFFSICFHFQDCQGILKHYEHEDWFLTLNP